MTGTHLSIYFAHGTLGSAGDRLYVGTIDGTLYALETIVQDSRATPASQEDQSGQSDGQR